MAEGDTKIDTGKQDTSPDVDAGKTFSQSDLDRIVSQRVNETKGKYEGHEQFREKSQIFDNMMDDPKFQKFVQNADKEPEVKLDPSEIKGMDDLKRYDPDIASAMENILEDVRAQDRKLYESEMKKVVEPFQTEMTHAKAQRAVEQVERMKSNTEEFPHMQSKEFQDVMSSLLSTPNPMAPIGPGNAPRAFSLEDAYDLASVHAGREGMELPVAPSQKDKAKKDAELLEDRGAGGEDLESKEPPKFKNAREATEWAMKQKGWM